MSTLVIALSVLFILIFIIIILLFPRWIKPGMSQKRKLTWLVRIGSLVEYWKGNILCLLSCYMDAQLAYERAIQINPHYYKRAIPINSNDENAWLAIARPLKRSGLFKEVLIICEKALSIIPDAVNIWSLKGVILFVLEQEEEALVCITKAKSLTHIEQEQLLDFIFDAEFAREIFLVAAWTPELDIFTRNYLYETAEKMFINTLKLLGVIKNPDTLEISEVIKNLDALETSEVIKNLDALKFSEAMKNLYPISRRKKPRLRKLIEELEIAQ